MAAARERLPDDAAEAGMQLIESVAVRPRTESVVLAGVRTPGVNVGGSEGAGAGA